jgi:hypothetical protein
LIVFYEKISSSGTGEVLAVALLRWADPVFTGFNFDLVVMSVENKDNVPQSRLRGGAEAPGRKRDGGRVLPPGVNFEAVEVFEYEGGSFVGWGLFHCARGQIFSQVEL